MFDFLKKNRGHLPQMDSGYQYELLPEDEIPDTNAPSFDQDSEDSIVFLSFPAHKNDCWICRECGTENDNRERFCAVCALNQ